MVSFAVTYENEIIKNQIVYSNQDREKVSMDENRNNPVFDSLAAEGAENIYHYIDWLGLVDDPNLMILSSIHHYYYDLNELKGVRTLVNIKQLNHINHIDSFLNNVCRVLPPQANFIGCFKDNKIHGGIVIPFYQSFKFLSKLVNIIDSRSERFLSRRNVIKILESHNFRITDMTEINNITYFCTQNTKISS